MNLFSFQMLKYFRKLLLLTFIYEIIILLTSLPSVMFDKIYDDNTENTTKQRQPNYHQNKIIYTSRGREGERIIIFIVED